MPFGALSPEQRIRIIMELQNAAQYVARMNEAAAATARLAAAESQLKRETQGANAQTFAQRQGLYTLRRYTFFATTAFAAAGFAVGALGLKFYNTMQTGSVAFRGFLGSAAAVNREMRSIYATAALTPFEFPDLVIATRRLLPFTKNIGLTNKLVLSLANALSAAGLITGAALTRGSLQLAHMFAIGRLTGQILYNMGRDNIPMQQALQSQFHLTGDAVRREVAGGLITAQMAAQALNNYIQKTPGYARAAINQSTRTLSGAWSTLKDLLGMGVGQAESGLFSGIQHMVRSIDIALFPLVRARKPVGIYDLATAFDKVLSPQTHIVINLFIFFRSVLHAMVLEFGLLMKVIQLMLWPLDKMFGLFGANHVAATILGYAVGTLVTLWIIGRARALLFAEAEAIAKFSTIEYGKAIIFANGAMKAFQLLMAGELIATMGEWAFATRQAGHAGAVLGETVFVNNGLGAKFIRMAYGVVPAITAAAGATWAWVGANMALIATAGIYITIAAVMIILYKKWKTFHNAVNDLWRDIIYFSPIIAFSLWDAFGPIGLAVEGVILLIRYWKQLHQLMYKHTTNIVPAARHATGTGSEKQKSWFQRYVEDPFKLISGFASGGTVYTPGRYKVGEGGPEILNLPAGATVTPMKSDHLAGTITVHIFPQDVYMDGKKVGEVLSTVYNDAGARQ